MHVNLILHCQMYPFAEQGATESLLLVVLLNSFGCGVC